MPSKVEKKKAFKKMSDLLPPNTVRLLRNRLRSKTYTIGSFVVGVFILFQVGSLVSVFWWRDQVTIETDQSTASSPPPASPLERETPAIPLVRPTEQPVQQAETKEKENDSLEFKQPESVPQEQEPASTALSKTELDRQILDLNKQAGLYREAGNYKMSEDTLMEAYKLRPQEIMTWMNFARLEEYRGRWKQARDYWMKVKELSDKAQKPEVYEIAMKKVNDLDSLEKQVMEKNGGSEFPQSVFVSDVNDVTDGSLPASQVRKNFVVRVKPPGAVINPGKLRIQLFFYEVTPEGKVIPSRPDNIAVKFVNPKPDWKTESTEVLEATYLAKVPGNAYYGYVIRLYYNNILQDERAYPGSLAKLTVPSK
jgi:tetratricopeptide (TPR) repeat protein